MLKSGGGDGNLIVRQVIALLIYRFSEWVLSIILRRGSVEDEDLFDRYRALRRHSRQGVYDLVQEFFHR